MTGIKLYAKIISPNETQIQRNLKPPQGDGWYEISREPDCTIGEYLEYDEKNDQIVIKKRETAEADWRAGVKAQIAAELPELIYQYKDNPSALVQALCDRANEIDQSTVKTE